MDNKNIFPFLETYELDTLINGLWIENGGIKGVENLTYNNLNKIKSNFENSINNNSKLYAYKYYYYTASLRLLEYRNSKFSQKGLYFGGIDWSYFGTIHKDFDDVNGYTDECYDIAKIASNGFMDVVTTAGKNIGEPIDFDKLKGFTKGTQGRAKLAIAGGVNATNIHQFFGYCDIILISTGISLDYYRIDNTKCLELYNLLMNRRKKSA